MPYGPTPSLLQTLLRQPTQSYSNGSALPAPPSRYDLSPNPSRRSSIRSGFSGNSRAESYKSATSQEWRGDGWDWSKFGGRAGLTGGAGSLHPLDKASELGVSRKSRRAASEAGSAQWDQYSNRGSDIGDDMRSLRSVRSMSSMRSNSSRVSRASSMVGNGANWNSGLGASLGNGVPGKKTSRRYSDAYSTAPPPSTSGNSASRRYSTLSQTATAHQQPINSTHIESKTSSSRKSSTRRTESNESPPHSDIQPPSLSSSNSSAISSAPVTPIQAIQGPFPHLNGDTEKKKKKRAPKERNLIEEQRATNPLDSVVEGDEDGDQHEIIFPLKVTSNEIERGEVIKPTEESFPNETRQILQNFAAASPNLIPQTQAQTIQPIDQMSIAARTYSVDEFFALAAPAPQPEIESNSASENEDEIAVAGARPRPRIQLTRTESDEAQSKIKGDVELLSTRPTSSVGSVSRKKPKKITSSASNSTRATSPEPILTVVSSSKSNSAGAALTTSNLQQASSTSTAAQDSPEWLKRIRALGEPIQPFLAPETSAKKSKAKSSEPHWSVRQYDQQQQQRPVPSAVRRPASAGNLRRPHFDLEPMPELDETNLSRSNSIASVRKPESVQEIAADIVQPTPAVRRAMSTISDSDAQSISGYSSMSLPTGAFTRPPKNPNRANRNFLVVPAAVDSATLRQSTSLMATLSVSAAAAVNVHPANKNSSSFSFFKTSAPLASSSSPRRFDPLRDLTFASLQPAPKKVQREEILVEVISVGLDRLDVEMAREMATKSDGFGFVPGRAFFGKAIECGESVSRIKRGDLVWGMTSMKKSSALSELIAVHRDQVSLAPSANLSVESLSALPISGTTAFQIMETLCSELPKGSKILILQAETGVGNLCLQLAKYLRPSLDLYLVAHCPPNLISEHSTCRAAGASDVIVDEPLSLLNARHEAEFDVVIDTIGGRRIYDASRRVLHHSGTFITTIGDSMTASTSTTHWKSSIRSLKRSFFKKDKKQINYWHLNEIDDRQSPREALDKLRDAVENGHVQPIVGKVWPFKDSMAAFGEAGRLAQGQVVRVKTV